MITEVATAPAAAPAPQEAAPQAVAPSTQAPAEAKPAEAKAEPPKPQASEMLERALRADKNTRAEREKLKAEQAAFTKERETSAKEVADAKRLAQLAKDDPRAFLEAAGTDYETFSKALARGHRVDPAVRELEQKLAKIESDKQAEKTAAEAAQRAAQEQAQERAIEEFGRVVKNAAAEFSTTAWMVETDPKTAKGLITDAVHAIHEETGRVPSYEDAAKRIEKTLRTDFERMMSVPAFKAIAIELLKREQPQQAQQANKGASAADGPSTLTNGHASAPGARGERPLTEEERFERLVSKVEAARPPKT